MVSLYLLFYPLKLEARGRDPEQNTLYHYYHKYILYPDLH